MHADIWVSVSPADLKIFILNNFGPESTVLMALGRGGMFGLEANGVTWWSALPKSFDSKMRGRQEWLPRVQFAALDASNKKNYYILFTNGSQAWDGPDSLTKALQASSQVPELLSFAPNGGWCVSTTKD